MKGLSLFSATVALLLSSFAPPPLPATEPRLPEPLAGELLKLQPGCEADASCFRVRQGPAIVAEPDFAASVPTIELTVPAAPPPAAPAQPVLVEAEPEPAPPPRTSGVRVVVSIPEQKAYVFEDGELVFSSPVSTGKRGHSTPAGTFPILQKKVHHRSNKYDNAPMPYMQRLTWSGIALHAGTVPGYPASHGCIRFPRSFAKRLYGMTDFSTLVTVTKERPRSAEEALELA